MTAPLAFRWDGEAMRPLRPKLADAAFVIGQNYLLDETHQRSGASHSHYFASLNEAWKNLPDDAAQRFPTVDHLRKYALIMAGYRDERTIVASSKAEAQRLAAFVRPMDDHAVVIVRDAVVRVWTAKSQSMRAMGAKDFQDSKSAVLAIVSDMIGVAPASLEANAGRAA